MPSSNLLWRAFLVAMLALLLVVGGIIALNWWPRVVRVEQRVMAPAAAAVAGNRAPTPLADILAGACPAVVAIGGGGAPPAAGFLISADGNVVAAADALGDGDTVRVALNDGRAFEAARQGTDPMTGLALLKIDAQDLPFLQLADGDLPRVGDPAVALAAPNATGCIAAPGTVTADFLAEGADRRAYVRMSPGPADQFVGAPVLDTQGRVLGVVAQPTAPPTAKAAEDMGLLVPAGLIDGIVSELRRSGHATDNAFGIVAQDLTPALAARIGADRQRGAVVALVRSDSPAARAGLKAGDIIFSAQGEPIGSASELGRALDTDATTMTFDVLRRSDRLSVTLRRQ